MKKGARAGAFFLVLRRSAGQIAELI